VPAQKCRRRDQKRRPPDSRRIRLAAVKNKRSAGRNEGRPIWRRSTDSSWRRTTISSSLNSVERNSNRVTCRMRWIAT
jgi:hypothetical protein